jgi:hypothetical protein
MFFYNGDPLLTQAVMTQMLTEFYTAMGWDACGCPLKETLAALGIDTERSAPLDFQTAAAASSSDRASG